MLPYLALIRLRQNIPYFNVHRFTLCRLQKNLIMPARVCSSLRYDGLAPLVTK